MAIDLLAVLRLDDQMTQSLKSVSLAATAGFAAITAAAAASVKTFMDVEQELKRTAALVGATSSEYASLEQAAVSMGSNSTKTMSEIASSMSELGASGFEVNEIIGAMPGIIKASEASGESLATAAGVVSSALNIWGLEAQEAGRVADVLTMSANVSAAGIDSLGEALKYAGAPAAVLGMSIEEVSAAIGVMVDSGIEGASAGTSLRAALLALNSPAKAQEKMMNKLGFSITGASGEAKSLVGIISNMESATKSMTAADKLATVSKLVGTEAASGFLALMSKGPAKIAEMTDALRASGGIAESTAEQMNESLAASFKAIGSKVEASAFMIGKALAPAVGEVARLIQNIDATPLINVANAVGSTFTSVFDRIADNWSTISQYIKPLAVGMAAFGAAIMAIGGASAIFLAISAVVGFISGPIALIAVGIGALAAGFYALYNNVKPIKDFFVTLKEQFTGGLFTGILNRDQGAVAGAISMADKIKAVFASIKDFVSQKIVELQPAIAMFSVIFANVKEIAVSMITGLWGLVGPIFSLLGNSFSILADIAVIAFNNIIAPAFLLVSEAVSIMWSLLSPVLSALGGAFEVLGEVVMYLWNTILAPFVDYWTTGLVATLERVMPVLDVVGGVFDAIGSAVSTAAGYVKGFADTIAKIKVPDWVTGLGSKAIDVVSSVIPGGKEVDGSHKTGLWSVPWDGYFAELHKSEIVLPAEEATAYRSIVGNSGSLNGVSGVESVSYDSASAGITNHNTYNQNTQQHVEQPVKANGGNTVTINKFADYFVVREEADIERIGDMLTKRILRASEGGAGAWG